MSGYGLDTVEVATRIDLHDHGYVKILDVMGTDNSVVEAARISYDSKGSSSDRGLIRYLLRHKHTTPFEMCVLKFELKMPLFVARQWVRHRTASVNEVSARYTQLPEEMFVPEVFSIQSKDNKQGRGDDIADHTRHSIKGAYRYANKWSYDTYEALLERGVAKEQARGVLNLNIYTKFVWKMDLHNLMHFLHLRMDPHAQKEIRDYAMVIADMVKNRFPICHEAFVDYVQKSYTCSRMEVNILQELVSSYVDLHDGQLDVGGLCRFTGMSDREISDFERMFL